VNVSDRRDRFVRDAGIFELPVGIPPDGEIL